MKKILLLIAVLVSIVGIYDFYKSSQSPSYAQSFGSLTVNFHSSLPGNAVFDIHNFLPGDLVTKTIDVKNNGNKTAEVFVRGIKTDGSPGNPKIEGVLDLLIKQGATTVFSGKLSTFFGLTKLSLGNLNKNQTKSFVFTVSFPTSAGNEYQTKFVKFNLEFSSSGDVKAEHDEKDDHDDHDDHNDDGHNHPTPTPRTTPTPRPTPTPTPRPTPTPTKTPTPTPKHDDDHGKFDFKKFEDDIRNRFDNFFKPGKH
jgi:hypothetical protein